MRGSLCLVWAPLLAVTLLGCPQSVNPLLEDGGTASGRDGGASGGRDGDVQADGGPTADAGAGADAGPADAGESARFRWSSLTLPNNTRTITSVWGRSPSEVYFGTFSGAVLRFDGAGLTEVWDAPNNAGIRNIDGTDARLFVASDRDLHVFGGSPGQDAPQTVAVGSEIGGLSVVDDELAFLVAERTSSRGLFRYDGTVNLGAIAPMLEVASVNGVWAQTGPKVWVASNGRIPHFDGLGTSEDAVNWPQGWDNNDIAYFFLYDIVGLGAHRLGVGSGGGVLSDANGAWQFERLPSGDQDFEAVAAMPGGGVETAVAVGEEVGGALIHWRTPDGWIPDAYRERVTLFDVWAAGPDEVFAVGSVRGSFDGVLLRGVRTR